MTSRLRRSSHTPAAKGGSWIFPATRWAIYHRDDFKCLYCGSTDKLTLDHRRSVFNGGTNKPTNLFTSCLSCNSSKQERSTAWFLLNVFPHRMTRILRLIESQLRKKLDRDAGRYFYQLSRGTRFGVLAHPGAWNG
jgi:5-methylcytosine-specific restriction endonuclease McrA